MRGSGHRQGLVLEGLPPVPFWGAISSSTRLLPASARTLRPQEVIGQGDRHPAGATGLGADRLSLALSGSATYFLCLSLACPPADRRRRPPIGI